MNTAKPGKVVLAAAVVAIAAILFFRAHRREIRLQALQEELQDLWRRHKELAAPTAADAAPVWETGFYQAESRLTPGFRSMAFAGTDGKTETLYVALLPDLILEDIAGAERRPGGLEVHLNAGGQARVRALTRERTQGGRKGREAILVDGRIVAAPGFRGEIRANGFMISGPDMEHADWAEELSQEISAANKATPP